MNARAAVLVALAACGSQQATQTQAPVPSQTAAPSQTSQTAVAPTSPTCKANDDCAMSNMHDCCAPCGLAPFADLKTNVDALASRCGRVHCSKLEPQECKPTESTDVFHAECQNSACIPVRNPPPPVQTPTAPALLTSTASCAHDADCVVSNAAGCCTSCEASAHATSKHDLEARKRHCAAVDCDMSGNEACSPFVDASLYRATCRAGTCAGIKR